MGLASAPIGAVFPYAALRAILLCCPNCLPIYTGMSQANLIWVPTVVTVTSILTPPLNVTMEGQHPYVELDAVIAHVREPRRLSLLH